MGLLPVSACADHLHEEGSTMAATDEFTHLHLHTQYSFLDGAIRMKDLIPRVAELGMKQVAVTDHGNMYGAVDFYKRATKEGIKPIMGMEAYVTGVTGDVKHTDRVRENFHLVLLAENNIGYDNLKKLSSKAFLDGKYYYPRIDKDLLFEHREGIIASTACLGGEVGKKCAKGDVDGAKAAAKTFKDIFGPDHFFLEVQPNGVRHPEQGERHLRRASPRSSASAHRRHQRLPLRDAAPTTRRRTSSWPFASRRRGTTPPCTNTRPTRSTSGRAMRCGTCSKSDYAHAFETACRDRPSAATSRSSLAPTTCRPFPIPVGAATDEADYLRHLSASRASSGGSKNSRYPVDRDEYYARLDVELDVIISMGFPGYFLIVQDFINWSKQNTACAWAPAAARAPARWSPTPCASPTSTPSPTTCSSSAS
jgi:DNA polymerase-3 subunit alpha